MVSHSCGSLGARSVHRAPLLVLARLSLCSGPRPDAAERLCYTRRGLVPLRINQIYSQAESQAGTSQVCQVFNLTNRN